MPCRLQMRKAANRMNFDFNKAEDEYIDGDEVVGLGTINKEGSGRLRLVASQQKVRGERGGVGGGGAAANGSVLAMGLGHRAGRQLGCRWQRCQLWGLCGVVAAPPLHACMRPEWLLPAVLVCVCLCPLRSS